MKILISDPLSKEGVAILKSHTEFQVDEVSKLSEDELCVKIKGYDALIIRSGTTVTSKIIQASDKLKVIGRAGVGVDNVDVEAASKKGIVVMNAPTGNTISTAEHAFSLMMALSRNIPAASQSVKQGKWERKKFTGVELYSKVLGIVGLGRIGTEIAKRAQSFEMKVIAFDPFLTAERAKNLNIDSVDLDTLFSRADFITVHTPLTEETKHLLDEKAFQKMKKGVRIINAARGGIVDEQALADNIRSGKVAGAALDVYESEEEAPLKTPVLELEQVITTPHLGASTEEAQINVAIDVAKTVSGALLGKGYRNAVNIPDMGEETMKTLLPFINLAEKLGAIQAQMVEGPVKAVNIKYAGEVAALDVSVITRAFMKGIFTPILEESVNYINALVIAKERGVKVSEKRTTEIMDFANLICVDVETDSGNYFIMGTLFANKEPRIVKINEFYLEAIPEGYMLFVSNKDVPGIVGKVGTILGNAQINIAGIGLGRDKKSGQAISILNVDNDIPKDVLKKLKDINDVTDVKFVKVGKIK